VDYITLDEALTEDLIEVMGRVVGPR
jgi:hypothetical protein